MERLSFVGSQNVLIDGYASAFAFSCKQRNQGQNIIIDAVANAINGNGPQSDPPTWQ